MTERQFVAFKLGKERYGVDICNVNSICEPMAVTAVPNGDDRVCGIINLRGDIIPVVDMKKYFGHRDNVVSPDARIIICQTGTNVIGFQVDGASQVIQIAEADIESTPDIINNSKMELIAGIGKLDGEIIILLDLDHMTEVLAS